MTLPNIGASPTTDEENKRAEVHLVVSLSTGNMTHVGPISTPYFAREIHACRIKNQFLAVPLDATMKALAQRKGELGGPQPGERATQQVFRPGRGGFREIRQTGDQRTARTRMSEAKKEPQLRQE